MILVLPYPVSNNRNQRVVGGRVVVSRESQAYKKAVGWIARARGCKPTQGSLSLTVWFHPKANKDGSACARRLDIDNVCKVVFDALNGIAWNDDSQIVRLHLEVAHPMNNGGLTVKIEDC